MMLIRMSSITYTVILVIKNGNAQSVLLKFGIGLLGVLFFTLVISSLILRFDTLLIEGSSVHYRLVAPLEVLGDVLMNVPFGVTFGLMEKVLSPIHQAVKCVEQTQLFSHTLHLYRYR